MTARQRNRVIPIWPTNPTPAHWTDLALCAEVDPELFFPEKGASTTNAKKVCRRCEVRTECLQDALTRDERYGVFGGLSERQRRKLRQEVAA